MIRPDGFLLTKAMAKVYGIRGGMARAASYRWPVEGENVSPVDIAKRLGIPRKTAHSRLRRLRDRGKPITWAALRLEKDA